MRANSTAWANFSTIQRPAQQPLRQAGVLRRRLHEAIGASEHARPAFEVDLLLGGKRRERLHPEKAHTAAKALRLALEVFQQFLRGRGHHVMGRRTQSYVHQRRHFDTHAKQIGDQAENRFERPIAGASHLRQDFLDARAEALLAAFQFFEQVGPLGGRAMTLPQAAQVVLTRGKFALRLGKLLLGGGQEAVLLVGAGGQFVAAAAELL